MMLGKMFALCIGLIIASSWCYAQGIKLDGSLGANNVFNGQHVVIPQNVGKTLGRNLFHSFAKFNIATGQTVEFTGSDELQNVIARVTGHQRSVLDGTLKSSAANADFYFINPNGIIFGPNAWVDVPGSFHASTADHVTFNDAHSFYANLDNVSTLSSAKPAEFGFLGTSSVNNGLILLDGAQLAVNRYQALDLVAGNISIKSSAQRNTWLAAPGGDIRLVAMQGQGRVSLAQQNGYSVLPDSSLTQSGGHVSVDGRAGSDYATLYASGDGAGRIAVWGREVNIWDATVYADNNGFLSAAANTGIAVSAQTLNVDRSLVQADTLSDGAGGSIVINAKTLSVLNGALISADAEANGDAGNVFITTSSLNIFDEAEITSSSWAAGNAGVVDVSADTIVIDGLGRTDSTGIKTEQHLDSTGLAGAVRVNAHSITLKNHGMIGAATWSDSDAGNVRVDAEHIVIDGQGSQYSTGILSIVWQGLGSGGVVEVNAKKIDIVNGGEISANTWAQGDAGDVRVTADSLLINGHGTNFLTGIFSDAYQGSAGSAGTIKVSANLINLTDDGMISSSTRSVGDAGQIDISANTLWIDGRSAEHYSGVFSATNPGSLGDGGNLTLSVKDLVLVGKASIATFSSGEGQAGDIYINANTLTINGFANDADIGISSNAIIFTPTFNNSLHRSPGNIDLVINQWLWLNFATISIVNDIASLHPETITPGYIKITAPNIMAYNSRILAEALINAPAGAITVDSLGEMVIENSVISSETVFGSHFGNIALTSHNALLLNASSVNTQSLGGAGGAILIASNGSIELSDSSVNTTVLPPIGNSDVLIPLNGDGGAITVQAGKWLSLTHSSLATSVLNQQGDGGDINVTANSLLMQTGLMQANARSGQGGTINLNVAALISSGNSLVLGGKPVLWSPAAFGFNVIQAASESGLSGDIHLMSPQLNLSAVLANFGGPQFDSEILSGNACDETGGSTLIRLGAGGLK
ncbi:two-partner secretion domain-containing protein [Methylocucumis oryzae]|nr:filamentous hemagglutinin N-terminal domain-containing protein [Methylocucumis oryzae]